MTILLHRETIEALEKLKNSKEKITVISVENNRESSELLKEIAAQSRSAFQQFYERYSGPVFHFVDKKSFDKTYVEEVVQDVFVSVWNKAAFYKPERGNVEQWVFTIARNKLYDYWRKLERVGDMVDIQNLPLADSSQFNSDESLLIEQTMDILSEDFKKVIQCVYLDGNTNKYCAKELEQPEGTIKWKARKALEMMKKFLEKPMSGGAK
ncbi:RNA polymerase sigma factor [bacterium]|nr:RNA polymerase sigma factor [bacterium]